VTNERFRRRIESLLDEADAAVAASDWSLVRDRANNVLALDPENHDALDFLEAADRAASAASNASGSATPQDARAQPASFASGRYLVKRFLGEGGKKKVYLAHDSLLDRDVAFALIKTAGLDEVGKERITREAQAMGRLGTHPNIVSIFDLGTENEQPFIVTELMGGGDVEGLIEKSTDHKLPIEMAIGIAVETCRGLRFAHDQGIYHRDLKPGNVWLTSDGRAKIGDFGLAVAVDRSRLTQAGMMVGTAAYMPPEQALGGAVTPRSDLYSLGAMLYEMVCGRPPFLGDESVAIIGQHLNTPPVAPTWHRPECPSALEALILRLLEKDPALRPDSAAVLESALEAIDADVKERERSRGDVPQSLTERSNGLAGQTYDPVYRRVFVGREQELRQLHAAFDACMSGGGSTFMVAGEPGIGKTAICEQLATYVRLRGGSTLVGHCYAEGSLTLPYLPFIEAIRSHVLRRDSDALRQELGSGASEVARIVSEVRDKVSVTPAEAVDPEEQRYRLLQSVTTFLRNASTLQPILIVLEDLHDADSGTLDLLLYLARNLDGARLMITGTYRDIEVDRSHPLSGTLGELRRLANFGRIPLRGLTAEEVQRMMAGVAQREITWSLAETVFRQTEGNPLFVQEMLRYMVEEGILVAGASEPTSGRENPFSGRIPEGLREVIGRRLSRLSPECNRVLAIAAVIGREFRLDTLQSLAAGGDDTLLSAVEEATRIGVLEEEAQPGTINYRFTHAFFRQTLYEELSAPRRLRLHQDVARVLEEQYVTRRQEHAAELADHFSHSTDRADLVKAVEYCVIAAKRAMSVFDYGEAVRLLKKAVDVQDVLDSNDSLEYCTLLLDLAEALMPAGQPLEAVEAQAEKAFQIANDLSHREMAMRACRAAFDAMARGLGVTSIAPHPLLQVWSERADRYAMPGTPDRVNADLAAIQLLISKGRWREANARAFNALEVARVSRDPIAVLRTGTAMRTQLPVWLIEQCLSIAEETLSLRQRLNPRLFVAYVSGLIPLSLTAGDAAKAAVYKRELEEFSARTHDPFAEVALLEGSVLLSTVAGDLDAAIKAAERIVERGPDPESPERGNIFAVFAAYVPWAYRGKQSAFLDFLDSLSENERQAPLPWSRKILCLAQNEQLDEASEELRKFLETYNVLDGDTPAVIMSDLLDAAVILKNLETANALSARVASTKFMIVPSDKEVRVLGRPLGGAFALLNKPDQARAFFTWALEAATQTKFQPEIALLNLELAELLLDHYPEERDSATSHLDASIALLREMKMQPSLERALRHRDLLKA
jgi:tetratricopeptide (TPR) repeat protein